MRRVDRALANDPRILPVIIWMKLLMLMRVIYGSYLKISKFGKKHHFSTALNAEKYFFKSGLLPRTSFANYVRVRMRFDRNPIVEICCDRIAARQYVAEKIGSEVLPQVFAVVSDAGKIPWETIPREFVAKVTHGSGGFIGVWNGISGDVELPSDPSEALWKRYWINPVNLNRSQTTRLLSANLKQNYAMRQGKLFEWGYFKVPRNVIVEELLIHEDGNLAAQTAIYCFKGVPKFIRQSVRDENHKRYFAWRDIDWSPLEFWQISIRGPEKLSENINTPKNFTNMLRIATELSSELDFVRVDLYDLGNRVVFGELTLYPSGGFPYFYPLRFNKAILDFL